MMSLSVNTQRIKQIIFDKEDSLLNSKTRYSRDYLLTVLADDFFEFGSSGKKHNKQEVISWLVNELPFDYEILDFNVEVLAQRVVLATYTIKINNSVSLRSSTWVLTDNNWQLKFHQGTSIREHG